jgi:hypothetical protein
MGGAFYNLTTPPSPVSFILFPAFVQQGLVLKPPFNSGYQVTSSSVSFTFVFLVPQQYSCLFSSFCLTMYSSVTIAGGSLVKRLADNPSQIQWPNAIAGFVFIADLIVFLPVILIVSQLSEPQSYR